MRTQHCLSMLIGIDIASKQIVPAIYYLKRRVLASWPASKFLSCHKSKGHKRRTGTGLEASENGTGLCLSPLIRWIELDVGVKVAGGQAHVLHCKQRSQVASAAVI